VLVPSVTPPDSGEATALEPESLLADKPVRNFSIIGLFIGAPDLADRWRRSCTGSWRNAPMLTANTGRFAAMPNAKD
jgi:hypothetical protein